MANSATGKLQVVFADDVTAGRIAVDLKAFLDYSFGVTHALQTLEARWPSRAAVEPAERQRPAEVEPPRRRRPR